MTDAVTAETEPASRGFRTWFTGLPRWVRIGFVAGLVIVVGLASFVAYRVLTRVPHIPLGVTAAEDLLPGSCLADAEPDLAEYEVVACSVEHPAQVFAIAPLDLDETLFSDDGAFRGADAGDALPIFADEVCERFLEYRLYLVSDLDKQHYEARSLTVPSLDDWRAGDQDVLCVIADEDGAPLTRDLYRPMP